MSTLTEEQLAAIAATVDRMHLPSGRGDSENACSVAAINLALTGRLTDAIPECMSPVIGRWIITTQDSMPDAMRNSRAWKSLLPLAAGTGRERERERERLAIILDHMWSVALPLAQPAADADGYGDVWRAMCRERTPEATWAAEAAAAATATWAAEAAAAWAAVAAAEAAAWAAVAATWAAEAAAEAAAWAAVAVAVAQAAQAPAAEAAAWSAIDPVALLARLVAVGEKEKRP